MTPARSDRAAPGWMVWSALWVVYLVWGSTYLAISVVVETMPPLLAASARFLVAGAVMWLVLRVVRGADGVRATAAEVKGSALIGALLLLGGNGLVSIAEETVPSGLTALLIAATPLWVVLWRVAARESVPGGTLVGVAVGFVGVALLVSPGTGGATLLGIGLILVAALMWATGSFFSKRVTLPKDPFLSTALQMLTGGAIMAVAGVARGEAGGIDVGEFSAASLWAFAYLIVAGSLFAFTAYVWLLQHAPISKVATYAYVNPVVAIFLGWLILDESLTLRIAIGATVIVASVAAIVKMESAAARRREELEVSPVGAPTRDREMETANL